MSLGILSASIAAAYRRKPVPAGSGGGGGGGGIPTTFDGLYSSFSVDTGTGAKTQGAQSVPAMSTDIMTGGYTDAAFGTKIRRITQLSDASGGSPTHMRHEYSKRSVYNADGSLFLEQSSQGWWFLKNAATNAVIPNGITSGQGTNGINGLAGDCEPIWHPTDRTKLWHTAQNGTSLIWYEYTVNETGSNVAGSRTTLFDLTAKLAALGAPWNGVTIAWFVGEGRPSDDGRYWGLQLEHNPGDPINDGFCLFDRVADTILFVVATGGNRPNWTGTSPSGAYVVASWYNTAASSIAAEEALPVSSAVGVRAYWGATNFRSIAVIGQHADLARNADGEDVYCAINFHSTQEGAGLGDQVTVRRLSDGAIFGLPIYAFAGNTGGGFHMSGCATERPGWIVIGRYAGVGSGAYDGQVIAAEMKATSPRICRLAHHRSSGSPYFAEPQPTTDKWLTRVTFASDFGSGASDVLSYTICLPSPAAGGIPHPATT